MNCCPFPQLWPLIGLTQDLNPGLLLCKCILYHLSHQGSPNNTPEWMSNTVPFCRLLSQIPGNGQNNMTKRENKWSMENISLIQFSSVQFSSVAQSCPTLCDPMNRSTPGLPVHHQLLEFTQTHVHQVSEHNINEKQERDISGPETMRNHYKQVNRMWLKEGKLVRSLGTGLVTGFAGPSAKWRCWAQVKKWFRISRWWHQRTQISP